MKKGILVTEEHDIKEYLKILSKKDIQSLIKAWNLCLKDTQCIDLFPTICRTSFEKDLSIQDYANYILDQNNSIEDRYANYFRLCWEYSKESFNSKNIYKMRQDIYKMLLLESINKYGFIKCKEDTSNKNKRLYIFTTQYFPKGNHSPSLIINKLIENLEKGYQEIFVIATPPYPFAYPLKEIKYYNYVGSQNNTLLTLSDNSHFLEVKGYLDESSYLEFVQQQNFTKNDKFILVGDSSIHFDIIQSDKKIVFPTTVTTINLNSAKYLCWPENILEKNIFDENYSLISSPSDFTKLNDLMFKPKSISKNEAINLAIIGNRLTNEIDSEFVKALTLTSQIFPNIKFKIIGKIEDKNILNDDLLPFIDFLGYIQDLPTYLSQNIHFYLNPNRLGGGQSAVMAYKLGIPIITLAYGDVYLTLNKKYSIDSYEKIPEFIQNYLQNNNFKKEIDNINKTLVSSQEKQFESFIHNIVKV